MKSRGEMIMVQAITDSNFKAKTDAGLTLTDFWATWCGPCKMQSPIIEELAEEIDFADIYKIDVDENQDTAQELGIMSIPTLLIKKDGEIVEKLVGFHDKEQLKAILSKHK